MSFYDGLYHIYFRCSKLFHVRPVTQGDVYRAETEEIPKIFQVKKSEILSIFCEVNIYI